jgi:dTMP kinase
MSGKYYIIEGLDFSGKSTHSKALARRLQDRGEKVIWTCEPGSPLHSLNVRNFLLSKQNISPKALELIYQADRAEHCEALKSYLENDYSIVSDRSFISGLAYAMAKGFEFEDITPLLQFVGVLKPTGIIFLDISAEEFKARKLSSGLEATREEGHSEDFYINLVANFKKIVETMQLPYIGIDGSKSMDEIEKIIDAFVG